MAIERPTVPGEAIVLRVAGGSNATSVAGALVKYVQENAKVSMKAIGAGAVNQMMKALAIGRGMAATSGLDLVFTCGFSDEMINGEKKTAINVFIKLQ
jgi:stage V sporulation protein S